MICRNDNCKSCKCCLNAAKPITSVASLDRSATLRRFKTTKVPVLLIDLCAAWRPIYEADQGSFLISTHDITSCADVDLTSGLNENVRQSDPPECG